MENTTTKRSCIDAKAGSFLEYDPEKRSKLEDTILQLAGKDSPVKSKPDMKKIEKCSILDKVKTFLPEFKKSTIELEKQATQIGSEQIDIENITGCDKVIEFDLSIIPNMDGELPPALRSILNGEDHSEDDSEDSSSESESESDVKNCQNLIEEI